MSARRWKLVAWVVANAVVGGLTGCPVSITPPEREVGS